LSRVGRRPQPNKTHVLVSRITHVGEIPLTIAVIGLKRPDHNGIFAKEILFKRLGVISAPQRLFGRCTSNRRYHSLKQRSKKSIIKPNDGINLALFYRSCSIVITVQYPLWLV